MIGVLGRPAEGLCRLGEVIAPQIAPPIVEVVGPGANPSFPEATSSPPTWLELTEAGGLGGLGRATRTLSGTTTTLKASSSELTDKPFNCAFVAIQTPAGPKKRPKPSTN